MYPLCVGTDAGNLILPIVEYIWEVDVLSLRFASSKDTIFGKIHYELCCQSLFTIIVMTFPFQHVSV